MKRRIVKAASQITIFYIALSGIAWLLFSQYPGIVDYFPIGTTERLFHPPIHGQDFNSLQESPLANASVWSHALFFATCFLSSIFLTIPVGCTYLATRKYKKASGSLSKAIIALPIAVTGLVLIVQNSLALAFSLAGIVAGTGIRFRTNIKEFTDTLFFLMAIGIGLAAGVGSLGLALMMSAIFCYTMLVICAIDYGSNPKDALNSGDEPDTLASNKLDETL